MGRQRYPVVGEWEETSKDTYPFPPPCMKCGHVYDDTEKFLRRETQMSYMRGDDEVETLCQKCQSWA